MTALTGLALSSFAATSSYAAILNVGSGQTYTTLQAAFNVVNPGDKIVVRSLTNPETATLTRSGTATSPVEIFADSGNDRAIMKGRIIINAKYVHLEGLRMEGLNGSVYNPDPAVLVIKPNPSGPAYVTIVRMDIRNYAAWGIKGTHGCYMADNYIYNSAGGIHVTEGAVAERNVIERLNVHSDLDGTDAPGDFFRVFGKDCVIRDNFAFGTIRDELRPAGQLPAHADFVQVWENGDYSNVLIEGNVAANGYLSQGIMINYDGTGVLSGWKVRNNVFAGYSGSGIYNYSCSSILIENNLFMGSFTPGAGHYGVIFESHADASSVPSGTVRNNICVDNEAKGLEVNGAATMNKDYNLFWGTGQPSTPAANDVVGLNPQFASQSDYNFRLLSTSSAINQGETRTGYTKDIEGSARSQGGAFDIGPYEYGPNVTLVKEAERLVVHDCSGDPIAVVAESAASNGIIQQYSSTGANDYVSYRIGFPAPGTYNVVVRVKKGASRGIFQAAIGTPGAGYVDVGSPVDFYNSSYVYSDVTVGSMTVDKPGCRFVRLKCTGKNASASGYLLLIDAIKLVKQ